MAVTPLDLVKCNMQIDPAKYKGISSGFRVLLKEQGVKGFFRGWVPTLLGYGAQGACKYGFYEFFKKYYSDIAGPEYAAKYKTLIYLAGSASAELIADVALCPFEAVKVRVQTQPGFARGLSDGLPKFVKSEGTLGLYKGLVPLWGRQIPYTMMKFASFETIVEMIYKYAIPKDQCGKGLQLGISFAGGYVAGILCAVVSHPADNLVSFLNNAKGATVGDVSGCKEDGFAGLFTRGLPLRILMIGTLTGTQWVIYDAFKVFVGLPTTGGVTPPAAPAAAELAKSLGRFLLVKPPGFNLVELKGRVHVFLVGDREHPQHEQTYKYLEKLTAKPQEIGYTPNMTSVIHDVDEEKEMTLRIHSDKLAAAFGILNSVPGTTIQIIKNLRVCGDCHTDYGDLQGC
ncbi:hypothetical protein FNV43_RR22395 [Rhamnella rubrinervis]|uniref:DYW domain-containing protein n=1 Tax=Rhamnella rubrinervis TaxID=2594499 RepID=A0A8K0DU85_9ROSA|nr:hypothetical protein FNV43_RR22395 [Rhamnella rubrinervis]